MRRLAFLAVFLSAVPASALSVVRFTGFTGRPLVPAFHGTTLAQGLGSKTSLRLALRDRYSYARPNPLALAQTPIPQLRPDARLRGVDPVAFGRAFDNPGRVSNETLSARGRAMFDGVRRLADQKDSSETPRKATELDEIVKMFGVFADAQGMSDEQRAGAKRVFAAVHNVVETIRAGREADMSRVNDALQLVEESLALISLPQSERNYDMLIKESVERGSLKVEDAPKTLEALRAQSEPTRKAFSSWESVLLAYPAPETGPILDFLRKTGGVVDADPKRVAGGLQMIVSWSRAAAEIQAGKTLPAEEIDAYLAQLREGVNLFTEPTLGEYLKEIMAYAAQTGTVKPEEAEAFRQGLLADATKSREALTSWEQTLTAAKDKK